MLLVYLMTLKVTFITKPGINPNRGKPMNTNREPRSWVQDDDSKSWREIAFDLQKQNINQRKEFERKDQLIETMARQLDTLKNTLQETKVKYQKEKNLCLIYADLYRELRKTNLTEIGDVEFYQQ